MFTYLQRNWQSLAWFQRVSMTLSWCNVIVMQIVTCGCCQSCKICRGCNRSLCTSVKLHGLCSKSCSISQLTNLCTRSVRLPATLGSYYYQLIPLTHHQIHDMLANNPRICYYIRTSSAVHRRHSGFLSKASNMTTIEGGNRQLSHSIAGCDIFFELHLVVCYCLMGTLRGNHFLARLSTSKQVHRDYLACAANRRMMRRTGTPRQ